MQCHQWRVYRDDVAKPVFRMRNRHVEVYGYALWVNQCTSDFHGVNEPIYKRSTMARRLLLRKGIGFLTRTGLTTWSVSDYYVLRTFPRSIGMRRLRSGMIPRTMPGRPKINKTRQKARSSATREYPSLIHTFFLTHTVNDVFLNLEDKALYEEMLRRQGLGSNIETGVPYTEDEIIAIVRGGKQRGHIPGVGRLFKSDDKFSQMLNQLESQPEIGGGTGSGGRGDDEQGDDEDDDEDGEDEDDS
ncbi:hypothetical protein Tco_1216455 [Tanacetum coccineum]